jgi:hypothetical protein
MPFIHSDMQGSPIFLIVRIDISCELSILLLVQGILYRISVTCLCSINEVLVHFLLLLKLSWALSMTANLGLNLGIFLGL